MSRPIRRNDGSVGGWMVRLAALQARRRLTEAAPVRVLVDVTVLYHAVTHETGWVSHGREAGYLARIPVHHPKTKSREYDNIKFLPGIVHLARDELMELLTSAELQCEQFHQPSGRFRGYGMFDLSLLAGLQMHSVDGHAFPAIGPRYLKLPTATEQQRARLRRYDEEFPDYAALVRCLGRRNSNDAWHLYTAERHGLFCYLTMDFSFVRTVQAQARSAPIRALTTLVLTPQQFAERFGILPVSPHALSRENADWFVHPELSMPGNERRAFKRYRTP